MRTRTAGPRGVAKHLRAAGYPKAEIFVPGVSDVEHDPRIARIHVFDLHRSGILVFAGWSPVLGEFLRRIVLAGSLGSAPPQLISFLVILVLQQRHEMV